MLGPTVDSFLNLRCKPSDWPNLCLNIQFLLATNTHRLGYNISETHTPNTHGHSVGRTENF